MSVVEVEDLTVEFPLPRGRLRAVDGISFAIEQGEAFGLVGESGSGKSVTALALLRLLEPAAEVTCRHLWFKGEDLPAKNAHEMRAIRGRHIGMVFQDPMTSLNPAFSVGEQIAEVYRYHLRLGRSEGAQRALDALDRVRLPQAREMYHRYPHEFSGGMRQRVMIAMAIACEPDLLIADEPTTALDVTIQAQILALLDELRRERRMALLFISHNLEVVAQTCDRVAVMYAGRLMEEAEPGALFDAPAHPYTEGLLRSIPQRERSLRAIPGAICDLVAPPSGCRFHPRCGHAQEQCRTVEPALLPMAGSPGRRTACHFPLGQVEATPRLFLPFDSAQGKLSAQPERAGPGPGGQPEQTGPGPGGQPEQTGPGPRGQPEQTGPGPGDHPAHGEPVEP